MLKTNLFSLMLICLFAFGLNGQSEVFYEAGHKIELFLEQDGVMKQEIAGLLEDSRGYIWIANIDYLLKYDGYIFKKYKFPRNKELPKIGQNNLRFLVEDKDGYIWISTFNGGGLIRFNPEKEAFTRVINDDSTKPLADNSTVGFSMDTLGNLWVGSNVGLTKITTTGEDFTTKKFFPSIFSIESKNYIDSLSQQPGRLIERINKVGNLAKSEELFELKQATKVLIINVGESYIDKDIDYGWIEDETGIKVWSMDATQSINADGAIQNRIQLDTLVLPAGKYHLKYISNNRHSFDKWYGKPPVVPEWWGIQVLDISGINLTRAYQLKKEEDLVNFEEATNTFPFKDNHGNQYVVAQSIIYKIHQKENGEVEFVPVNNELKGYNIRGITVGENGNLWVIAETYNPNTKSLFSYSFEENELKEINHGLPNLPPARAHLQEDQNGNLWLGFLINGLYKLSPPFYTKSDSINSPNITMFSSFGERPQVRALEIDSKNNLWVGFRQRYLSKLNLNQSDIEFVDVTNETDLKEDDLIRDIFEDSQGNVWFTSIFKGLVRYNPSLSEVFFYQDDFFGIDPKKLIVLREDENQNLWMADDGQLVRYSLLTNAIKVYPLPTKDKTKFNVVVSMVEDDKQQIWVLSYLNGLYRFDEATGDFTTFIKEKSSLDIMSSMEDMHSQINQLIKDKDKGFWALVGQGRGPLLHLDINGKKIDTLHKVVFIKNVLDITQDLEGNIWGGSSTDLLCYHVKKDSVFTYSSEEGLEHNKVFSLIADNKNNIWLYTPLGLSRFNQNSKEFTTYRQLNAHKPAQGNAMNLDLVTKNRDGTIKALVKGGFLSFHPDSLRKSTITPTIQIEKIHAAGKPIYSNGLLHHSLKNNLSLSYNQNDLSIDFLGINFDDAKSQPYAYQLEGLNEDWVNVGTEQTARYPNLSPGNYTFKVKAANADGIWSEAESISFIITPPWWQTWWAYLLYAITAIGAMWWYIQNLNKKLQKEQAHSKELQTLNVELADINTANQRFVPNDFLQILGKESIKDLKLGDQTQTQMTVLFSDIRDYTPLSESMTPEENFKFINAYLGRVGPIIKEHGGFISTYLGDGFMALFVNEPENALKASIAAQKELDNYNRERLAQGKKALKTGMGLNTGDLMLGVIGDEHRYESTVISDAVNTASRMEGLTKIFGAAIILSEKTLMGLDVSDTSEVPDTFAYRSLGKVKVKGKDKALKIYDLYEGETVAVRQLKAQTKLTFEQGITHYFNREFGKAAECFKQVLEISEGDKAAQYYLDKSVHYIVNGVSENWSGVEEMLMK